MDTTVASAVRQTLQTDLDRGVTRLAELASRHANDRDLVYRTILLKRELSRTPDPPSREQIAQGLALLDALVADQAAAAESSHQPRHLAAEKARQRALTLQVPDDVVLSCRDLGLSYRRSGFALENVSFETRYGEIVGVVGRNGNGKTTLLRIVVGELRPARGVLRFPALQADGTAPRWSRLRRHIAYVPQELPPWYGSLRSNLHYEAAIHGIRGAANALEVDFIVERLGLTDELDKRWQELSGGYKLRLALARALVWKPRLLVLDEPLANLDFVSQQVVLDDLRHLADSLRYPLSILMSSQHVHEVEEVSDKLLLLGNGHLKYFGPTDAIGAERRTNRFELTGPIELQDLQAALTGPDYHSIQYSGVAFVVTTSTAVTPETVLRRLLDAEIPITYFRDISRSAKSVIQDDDATE
jgi:ABC-2 type transport system ATP-binding protein